MFDEVLSKILEQEAAKEKARKKKKKQIMGIPKEKRLNYYSGWHKDDKPMNKEKGEIENGRKNDG